MTESGAAASRLLGPDAGRVSRSIVAASRYRRRKQEYLPPSETAPLKDRLRQVPVPEPDGVAPQISDELRHAEAAAICETASGRSA